MWMVQQLIQSLFLIHKIQQTLSGLQLLIGLDAAGGEIKDLRTKFSDVRVQARMFLKVTSDDLYGLGKVLTLLGRAGLR